MQSEIQVEHLSSTEILSLHSHVINEQTCDTVSAKDLHIFLDVGRHFAAWMKARITQYQFVENEDFILITPNGVIKNQGGDRRSLNYFITLDMAKELAMVERNEKGREARRYFINCERQLKAVSVDAGVQGQLPSDKSAELQRSLVTIEEQAKYRMLNGIVKSMEFKEDTLVIPAIEMINMVRAVRMYQDQIARLQSPDWVNEQIETIKTYTSRSFCE